MNGTRIAPNVHCRRPAGVIQRAAVDARKLRVRGASELRCLRSLAPCRHSLACPTARAVPEPVLVPATTAAHLALPLTCSAMLRLSELRGAKVIEHPFGEGSTLHGQHALSGLPGNGLGERIGAAKECRVAVNHDDLPVLVIRPDHRRARLVEARKLSLRPVAPLVAVAVGADEDSHSTRSGRDTTVSAISRRTALQNGHQRGGSASSTTCDHRLGPSARYAPTSRTTPYGSTRRSLRLMQTLRLRRGRSCPPFKRERMTWIKPSFPRACSLHRGFRHLAQRQISDEPRPATRRSGIHRTGLPAASSMLLSGRTMCHGYEVVPGPGAVGP